MPSEVQVEKAARALVEHLNKLLSPMSSECARLEVEVIQSAHSFVSRSQLLSSSSLVFSFLSPPSQPNYRVTVQTSPSGAVFEVYGILCPFESAVTSRDATP